MIMNVIVRGTSLITNGGPEIVIVFIIWVVYFISLYVKFDKKRN